MKSTYFKPSELAGKWRDVNYNGKKVGMAKVCDDGKLIVVIEDDSLKHLLQPECISFEIRGGK